MYNKKVSLNSILPNVGVRGVIPLRCASGIAPLTLQISFYSFSASVAIFTVMSKLTNYSEAINLSQDLPDFNNYVRG